MTLKIGISGLRGTVDHSNEQLTARTVVSWVQAFVGYLHSHGLPVTGVALGHDARRSSPALAALARGALLAAGAEVYDLGLTLTPTLQHAVHHDARLAGGLMITASHNPIIWNGLKFLDKQGFFLPVSAWEVMAERIERGELPVVPLDQIGGVREVGHEAWQAHQLAVLSAVPADLIRQQSFRVVLDACNGGAARWAEPLRQLGCEVLLLHSEQDGFFAREAEPLPAHLGALRALVRHSRTDLGFAADPDGDRLVLVDADGRAVSEEHTVVLVAQALATPGDRVVANVVTTHALEGALPGVEVVRTAVGEMNVVAGVQRHGAVLGGEGSGGIIVPKINLARDGLVAAVLVLTLMAERKAGLADLVAALPAWRAIKEKLPAPPEGAAKLRALAGAWGETSLTVQTDENRIEVVGGEGSLALRWDAHALILTLHQGEETLEAESAVAPLRDVLARLHTAGEELQVDVTDGVKLVAEGAWLSLRASNTEPIFRLMAEVREDD